MRLLLLALVLGLSSGSARAQDALQGVQQVTYVAEGYMEDETKCGPPQDALLNTVRLALNADTKIREANTRDGFPLVYVNLVSIWSESLCANYIELRVSQLLQIKLPQQNKAREHEVVTS